MILISSIFLSMSKMRVSMLRCHFEINFILYNIGHLTNYGKKIQILDFLKVLANSKVGCQPKVRCALKK
jgi:hypothetical protein